MAAAMADAAATNGPEGTGDRRLRIASIAGVRNSGRYAQLGGPDASLLESADSINCNVHAHICAAQF
jgi:hypothetical protein